MELKDFFRQLLIKTHTHTQEDGMRPICNLKGSLFGDYLNTLGTATVISYCFDSILYYFSPNSTAGT